MGAPNNATARSTISMARSTPAQNPRGLANSICISFPPSFQQGIQQKTGGAYGNGRICHVECRKIRPIPVKVNEIYDMPQSNAIDDVAEGSPEHERKPASQQRVPGASQPQQPDDDADADESCQADEHPALPTGSRGEKAERRSDVVHSGDVEDRQHADELEFTKVLGYITLAELVGQNYKRQQDQPDARAAANLLRCHANRRSSPGPSMLLTQRAQISGWRGSLPTSARN